MVLQTRQSWKGIIPMSINPNQPFHARVGSQSGLEFVAKICPTTGLKGAGTPKLSPLRIENSYYIILYTIVVRFLYQCTMCRKIW